MNSKSEQKTMDILYEQLRKLELSFPLHDNIIPFFLAVSFSTFVPFIEIRREIHSSLTMEKLYASLKAPEKYTLIRYELDVNENKHLQLLEQIFNPLSNGVRTHISHVFYLMQRWFEQLPAFSKYKEFRYMGMNKEFAAIDKKYLKLQYALQSKDDYAYVLCELLPEMFNFSYIEVINGVKEFKSIYDNYLQDTLAAIKDDIMAVMEFDKDISLLKNFQNWYESLDESVLTIDFVNAGKFFKLFYTCSNDEVLLESLVNLFYGYKLRDHKGPTLAYDLWENIYDLVCEIKSFINPKEPEKVIVRTDMFGGFIFKHMPFINNLLIENTLKEVKRKFPSKDQQLSFLMECMYQINHDEK